MTDYVIQWFRRIISMAIEMLFLKKGILVGVLVVLILVGTKAQSPAVEADKAEPRAFLKCPTARAATFMYFSDSWTEVPEANTEYDYLNCGNVKITRGELEGKCGVCGDYYNGPRHNEFPNGKYASIRYPTYIYREGSIINVTVQVAENGNGGYFVFKLCDSDALEEKQSCFDETVLSLARSPGVKKIYVPRVNASNDIVVPLQLPERFSCNVCTMQWTWVTNIDEGCEVVEGKHICGEGLGPQTTLVNCADIAIMAKSVEFPKDFPWPDFTSKYDTMAHDGDKHPISPVDPHFPPPEFDRIKDDSTAPPVTTKKPSHPLLFPDDKNPYKRKQPLIPRITERLWKPKTPAETETPVLDKRDYKKAFGGLGLGLLETLIPVGLLMGFGGMLSERLSGHQRQKQILSAQPGLILNGGIGLSPVAAEHRMLIGEQILPMAASSAAGGLAGATVTGGVPGLGPLPLAGPSPVLTGVDLSEAQIQQLIPLVPVISTPEVLQMIPESLPGNSRLGTLIPLIIERRRLVQIYPHLTPHQITQMHLHYRDTQRQSRLGVGQSDTNAVYQGQSGFGGALQGQGGVVGGASVNVIKNAQYQSGNQQWYSNNVQNNPKSGFFELPQGHSFISNVNANVNSTITDVRPSRGDIANPEFEFDREPDVLVERENHPNISPYSKNCPPTEQVCRSRFTAKEPTIYGAISIMEMICEIECKDGKHSCPAKICICACPENEDVSLVEMLEIFDNQS